MMANSEKIRIVYTITVVIGKDDGDRKNIELEIQRLAEYYDDCVTVHATEAAPNG